MRPVVIDKRWIVDHVDLNHVWQSNQPKNIDPISNWLGREGDETTLARAVPLGIPHAGMAESASSDRRHIGKVAWLAIAGLTASSWLRRRFGKDKNDKPMLFVQQDGDGVVQEERARGKPGVSDLVRRLSFRGNAPGELLHVKDWPQFPLLVRQRREARASAGKPGVAAAGRADTGAPDASARMTFGPGFTIKSASKGIHARRSGTNATVLANHDAVRVDSPVFEGATFLYVKNASCGGRGLKAEAERELRKRESSFVLKGRFKRRVRFSDLTVGHEFPNGVLSPPRWQRRVILGFLGRFFPHLRVEIGDAEASALAPVVLECKRMKVSNGGASESTEMCNVQEDTTLLGGYFSEGHKSPEERHRFFRREGNMDAFFFEPGPEYTFEFHQNAVSFRDYKLRLGVLSLGIARILKGYPLQFLVKDRTTEEYLCYFQFWSACLLKHWS